jgi:nucleotide-binding universal stress UspA family protein
MPKEFGRILVPVDGSEVAKKAATKALAIAKSTDIEVLALHVLTIPGIPTLYAYPTEIPYQQLHDLLRREGRSYLEEIEKLGTEMGVNVSTKLVDGHPAEEILKEAKEDDLIVIGSKGRTALDRLLMGSVAENVVRHAPCPVMIVR